MAKRHDDALFAQAGACNPVALSNALAAAFEEADSETRSTTETRKDAACRMIMHQLCWLLGMSVKDGFGNKHYPAAFDWQKDEEACRRLATDDTLRVCGLKRPEPVSETAP